MGGLCQSPRPDGPRAGQDPDWATLGQTRGFPDQKQQQEETTKRKGKSYYFEQIFEHSIVYKNS